MASSNKRKKNKKQSVARSTGGARGAGGGQWLPFVTVICSLLVMLCIVIPDKLGIVGGLVSKVMFGTFGASAFLIPPAACAWVFRGRSHALSSAFIIIFMSATVSAASSQTVDPKALGGSIAALWNDGGRLSGGGVVGGLVGGLLRALLDWGAVIVCIFALAAAIFVFFDITPHTVWVWVRYRIHKKREQMAHAASEQRKRAEKYRYSVRTAENTRTERLQAQVREGAGTRKRGSIDAVDDSELADRRQDTPEDTAGEESVPQTPAPQEMQDGENERIERTGEQESGEIDLVKIFSEESDGELPETEAARIEEQTEGEPELTVEPVCSPEHGAQKRYILPPIYLLKQSGDGSGAAGEEAARANAVKLVKTLASFKVNTHVAHISRGPRITRYELVPEDGVRVRSVANLVDDISLSLATDGVRIEAPIPGKSAIGIEVPNKDSDTVGLRELIDNPEFKNSKSKLLAALGVDVVGNPRYCDIAKMPHLLVAGTTGSGKSVCINSIICSLLYRATPDEVKLILIDPKKVEFGVYNGLPHLLVPVVSHPKKAAGTLNWACIEMERRFDLIEDVGVRDIAGYNEVTKDDPDREHLPQIVIIIDELADLMMTAKDDVETSICRIAQKARACGMHLIIGTQRPSVDVITGLIKANVPSRIAFTVVSQVDSRTIIDIAGAEKLVGRGDMLYSPVGSPKPVRVQGAFVTDDEVAAVVDFIKTQNSDADYDNEIVESIEKEAERCGTGKKSTGAGDDAGEDDPKLMEALEVAVDAGKISTSLLQRRLSVGYGKAAKLIDQLEAHGWVGPLDGSKPREVRISKQQYMEMVLEKKNSEDA